MRGTRYKRKKLQYNMVNAVPSATKTQRKREPCPKE